MPLIDAQGAALAHDDAQALRLGPDARAEEVAAQLGGAARVEILFPKFRDGRGFTLARMLRERFGFAGDIRAVGHFLPDQLAALVACGFTSFETPAEHDSALYAAAVSPRQPGQLLRRFIPRAQE